MNEAELATIEARANAATVATSFEVVIKDVPALVTAYRKALRVVEAAMDFRNVDFDHPSGPQSQRLCAALVEFDAERGTEHETQETITRWARETFGEPSSNLQIAVRALGELIELVEVLQRNDADPAAIPECADVHIVLCQIPERMGYNLQAAVDDKMKVNRSRTWRTNGDGTGQHIE